MLLLSRSVLSNSVRPHRWQPTRLPRPWDSPGKNAGVGCHFLLQCMKVKNESEVSQSCLTLCDPMDCSLPDSSIHGSFQARVLEWVASAFSATYLRLLLFFLAILILACASSSLTFRIMCSAYKLNKQGNNIALMYSFPNFEPVCYSMSGSDFSD